MVTPNMRDFEKNPYTPEEQRIAKYLVELTGIGGGEDPVGFLIASHATLSYLNWNKKENQHKLGT